MLFVSQALIISGFLTLGLFAGGVASAVNTVDIQDDYLDQIDCKEYDPSNDFIRELCNDLEEVRASQVSAAVSPVLANTCTPVCWYYLQSCNVFSYVHGVKQKCKILFGYIDCYRLICLLAT